MFGCSLKVLVVWGVLPPHSKCVCVEVTEVRNEWLENHLVLRDVGLCSRSFEGIVFLDFLGLFSVFFDFRLFLVCF